MLTVLKEWSQMDSPQWWMVANLPGSFGSAVHRQWWDSWVAVVWPWMRKFSSDMEFCINTRFGWCNGIDFGQDQNHSKSICRAGSWNQGTLQHLSMIQRSFYRGPNLI